MRNKAIIVLKATDATLDIILKNKVYASANMPKQSEFAYFVLLGEKAAIGTRVIAFGKISSPEAINEETRCLFHGNMTQSLDYEYKLEDIVDLQQHELTVDDVFLPEDADALRFIVQFGYADYLLPEFIALIHCLSNEYPAISNASANNLIQNNRTSPLSSVYECPYEIGMNVYHKQFGRGEIIEIEETSNEELNSNDAIISINFLGGAGTKRFSSTQAEKFLKHVE